MSTFTSTMLQSSFSDRLTRSATQVIQEYCLCKRTSAVTAWHCKLCSCRVLGKILGSLGPLLAADWDLALGVNVKGYAFGTKHAALAMKKQAEQVVSTDDSTQQEQANWPYSILNISSTGGQLAVADMVPYCSTKGAVIQMTKSSALDLAKYKIR